MQLSCRGDIPFRSNFRTWFKKYVHHAATYLLLSHSLPASTWWFVSLKQSAHPPVQSKADLQQQTDNTTWQRPSFPLASWPKLPVMERFRSQALSRCVHGTHTSAVADTGWSLTQGMHHMCPVQVVKPSLLPNGTLSCSLSDGSRSMPGRLASQVCVGRQPTSQLQ